MSLSAPPKPISDPSHSLGVPESTGLRAPLSAPRAAPSLSPPIPEMGNARRSDLAAARYQASGTESISNERLVVMLCERLLKDIDDAHEAIIASDMAASHQLLIHAQEILEALQRSLDVDKWSGAQGLLDLYDYAQRELVAANVSKSATRLIACRAVLVPIVEGWQEAWKLVNSAEQE